MKYIDFCLNFQNGLESIFLGHLTLGNYHPNTLHPLLRDQIKHILISNATYQLFNQSITQNIKNTCPPDIKSWPKEHIDEFLENFTLIPCKDTQLTLI